ncbi:hypothetical protein Cgig2_024705 [Carnegiea gigantea]|uniref:Uncharacterized protein n=1 Tax=Carnegiea gigantea TaxID=171969 RepID=A0A9Q1JNJ1_9CARY|nr:hypothetical protein Cgig2_024705 [Carnegiea gigantea]
MREALRRAREALTLEKVAQVATKKELEYIRELLIGRGQGDSLPGGMHNEGLQCADGDSEGSTYASERRVSISQGNDRHSFRSNLQTADVGALKMHMSMSPSMRPWYMRGEIRWLRPPLQQRRCGPYTGVYRRTSTQSPLREWGSAEWGMCTRPANGLGRRPPTQAKQKRWKRSTTRRATLNRNKFRRLTAALSRPSADNTPTVAAGDAPISQVRIIPFL